MFVDNRAAVYLANVSCLTVWVSDAFRAAASDCVRLGDQAALTAANGVARQVEGADRPRTAGGRLAGIRPLHTPLVGAHKSACAVRVSA